MMILKVSPMLLALNSLKLSGQSPPCRRNALPMATLASRSSRFLASPAKTMEGPEHRLKLLLIWVLRQLERLLGLPSLHAPRHRNRIMGRLRRCLRWRVTCCFGGLLETTEFLSGRDRRNDLRLEGMEGWWGLVECRRED
jgi:hypothetical protein